MTMLAELTQKDVDDFNAGVIKLCGVLQYLLETRDERAKGNILAPEKILFDAMSRLTKSREGTR